MDNLVKKLQKTYNSSFFDHNLSKSEYIYFNKGDITHLLIELASEVVELKMGDDSKWQMLQPETSAVKQTTLDTILNNISSYETDDFVEADTENPFEGTEKITVTLNDGSTRILMAAEEKDGKHQVKPLDQDQIFSVYKYKYNQLFKPSADLKDDTPPPSEDENNNELVQKLGKEIIKKK
mgnify:CR=1 FL=1